MEKKSAQFTHGVLKIWDTTNGGDWGVLKIFKNKTAQALCEDETINQIWLA